MLSVKKFTKRIIISAFLLILAAIFTVLPVYAAPDGEVYLGGFAAGFMLNTQTVEVIGVCDVMSDEGLSSPARECGIRSGDIISKVNGYDVTSAEELTRLMNEDFNSYNLTLVRGGETVTMDIKPVTDRASGKKRFGLLVKDSLNGIGTITYIDKNNNTFASLGHPVTDGDGNLVKINGGSIYGCMIYDVKRGWRGNPGELKGIFENDKMIGNILVNSNNGIYGNISREFSTDGLTKIEKGTSADATIGKAKIYSSLSENCVCDYDISIVKIDSDNKDNRNYVIKIDDKRLLDKSGGIVQGMSGSPIVQNGKLVGAVTHVDSIIWIPAMAIRHI